MAMRTVAGQAARPYSSATGLSGVLVVLFALLNEFGFNLRDSQVTAIVLAVAVVGNYIVAVTGNAAVKRVLLDPEVPTVDQAGGVRAVNRRHRTGSAATGTGTTAASRARTEDVELPGTGGTGGPGAGTGGGVGGTGGAPGGPDWP